MGEEKGITVKLDFFDKLFLCFRRLHRMFKVHFIIIFGLIIVVGKEIYLNNRGAYIQDIFISFVEVGHVYWVCIYFLWTLYESVSWVLRYRKYGFTCASETLCNHLIDMSAIGLTFIMLPLFYIQSGFFEFMSLYFKICLIFGIGIVIKTFFFDKNTIYVSGVFVSEMGSLKNEKDVK